MLTVITGNKQRIQEHQEKFKKSLMHKTDRINAKAGFQGDSIEVEAHYCSTFDMWFACRLEKNRYWNAFGKGKPHTGENLSISCEINFPFEGLDRRIVGAFAEDEEGRVFVLHRGKLGGGKKGTGKTPFQSYRGKWIEAMDDNIKHRFVLIGELTSAYLPTLVHDFMTEVIRIRP